MKYDSLIFDLDGTLWDALDVSAGAFTEGFRHYGSDITVTREELRKVTGLPWDQCLEKMYPGVTIKYPRILEDFDRLERAAIEERGGKIYPGVCEGIALLSEKYPLFIVSNCGDWYLRAFLRHSCIEKYIADHDCYGRSGLTKTAMIERMKSRYQLQRPVYVGDTHQDYIAAMESRCEFVFAGYGFGSVDARCLRVDSFSGLVDLVCT